jgi:1-acyl-sn-glycerol-3-phosphate acyltransferase
VSGIGGMDKLQIINGCYETPVSPAAIGRAGQIVSKTLISLEFYSKVISVVYRGSRRAQKTPTYGVDGIIHTSMGVFKALESIGAKIRITGMDNFSGLETPCVFISNHMSVLETFILPSIIGQFKYTTFVVKESLMKYPVFRHIMRTLDPVVVGRANPREDLVTVLRDGTSRLAAGMSVVVFPQSTRSVRFDPGQFNSIGVKLALRAGVPIIPIALKTDAWGIGKFLKDYGPVDPGKTVYISFGKAMEVEGRGAAQHRKVIDFIQEKLGQWKD